MSALRTSVCGRHLDVIDHQHFQTFTARLHRKPQLLSKGREQLRATHSRLDGCQRAGGFVDIELDGKGFCEVRGIDERSIEKASLKKRQKT